MATAPRRHRPSTSSTAPVSPLDEALRQVGDRWTLLVVESLLDGLAPNILSRRLKDLEAQGLIAAAPYSQRPYRVAYSLTAPGAELAGALRLLAQWGAHRGGPGAAPLHHATCGTAVEARWWCPTCERDVADDEAPEVHHL
jgi:DNA-binding HxlR family transcriptional regulator